MDWILFAVLAALLVFMFWNSRKRMQKAKVEQEEKRRQTVPGSKVLLQGGLYGTIVAYDAEDLDKPAEVELAPGFVVEVHSQAILRIVDPVTDYVTEDEFIEAEVSEAEYLSGVADGDIDQIPDIERIPAESEVRNDASFDENDKDKPGV